MQRLGDPGEPASPPQRKLFRRLALGFSVLFLFVLVLPHGLFRAGHRDAAMYAGGLGLPFWFVAVGLTSERLKKRLTAEQGFDGCLLGFLSGGVLLGSLLFLILRYVAAR